MRLKLTKKREGNKVNGYSFNDTLVSVRQCSLSDETRLRRLANKTVSTNANVIGTCQLFTRAVSPFYIAFSLKEKQAYSTVMVFRVDPKSFKMLSGYASAKHSFVPRFESRLGTWLSDLSIDWF